MLCYRPKSRTIEDLQKIYEEIRDMKALASLNNSVSNN